MDISVTEHTIVLSDEQKRRLYDAIVRGIDSMIAETPLWDKITKPHPPVDTWYKSSPFIYPRDRGYS
jgi:hypothetical protein